MRVRDNSEHNEQVSHCACYVKTTGEHKEEKFNLPGIGESQEHKF